MKNILVVIITRLLFIFIPSYSVASDCSHIPHPEDKTYLSDYDGSNPYWHCVAISNSGWGKGGGLTKPIAIENALCNCKIDGYSQDVCHIDHCGVQ